MMPLSLRDSKHASSTMISFKRNQVAERRARVNTLITTKLTRIFGIVATFNFAFDDQFTDLHHAPNLIIQPEDGHMPSMRCLSKGSRLTANNGN